MNQNMLDDAGKQFLLQLFKESNADVSAKVSMYEIGEALEMDRGQTDFIISELISFDYVEIRTLSGGIGITAQGVDAARTLAGKDEKPNQSSRLGSDPVLNDTAKNACDMMAANIKSGLSKLRLDFDAMAEVMADLKTIDAQLNSPKPKTGIIRECFRSILSVLENAGDKETSQNIHEFIG